MGFWSVVANVATGGVYGAVDGLVHGDVEGAAGSLLTRGALGTDGAIPAAVDALKGEAPKTTTTRDDSDLMIRESNNSKETAIAQIESQRFTMRQSAVDRELKQKADLELTFEKFDTKLQVGQLEYRQAMMAAENKHIEKLASLGKSFQSMSSSTESPDLAPPPSET